MKIKLLMITCVLGTSLFEDPLGAYMTINMMALGIGHGAPVKLEAELDEISGNKNEYMLKYNSNIIDISSNNVKIIMMTSNGGKTYQYIDPSEKSAIIGKPKEQIAPMEYIFITGEGKIYYAEMK